MQTINRTTSSASSSSLVVAHAPLKWLHAFVPYHIHNPMDAPIVRNILEASKRDKAKPVTKKLPLSSTIVKKIIEKHASRNADLKNLRIAQLYMCYRIWRILALQRAS